MARLNSALSPKLNDDIINKLQSVKIFTVVDFATENEEKLIKITGLSFKDIDELKRQIVNKFGGKVKNPQELLIQQKISYSTGITCLDNLLSGGLYPGQIYEICGKSSSGKSQLCYTIAINISIKSSGIIHYICTKKDFSAARIQMILDNKKLNDELSGQVMNQINITYVKNSYELLNILHNLSTTFQSTAPNQQKCNLIIIDSLPGIFFMSAEKNHENFYLLNHLSNICRYLSNEYSLPIMTVNLVSQAWRVTDGFQVSTDIKPMKPTLGKYWLHVPNTRLLIEKIENNETRKISVWMCEDIKVDSSVQVIINNAGVT